MLFDGLFASVSFCHGDVAGESRTAWSRFIGVCAHTDPVDGCFEVDTNLLRDRSKNVRLLEVLQNGIVRSSEGGLLKLYDMREAKSDHARGRTWNLLIRSQAPCHWATRPLLKLC